MNNFVIVTDSSADLSAEMVAELGVEVLPLAFTMGEVTRHNYPDNREMSLDDFYQALRDGALATTSAVNVDQYNECIEGHLSAGRDVLVLAFSSGLSATYQCSNISVEEMAEKYPDRKVYTVDTLCAAAGQGLLVWEAVQQQRQGKSIDEVRAWAEENKGKVAHWFTVDDLMFLKRGGRVSAASAVVGTMLSIKPVLHVDDEGKLISMEKARGRGAALKALVNHVEKTGIDPENNMIFISHGDCEADALKVKADLESRFGAKNVVVNGLGPVIGAHTGPGIVALFFWGRER